VLKGVFKLIKKESLIMTKEKKEAKAKKTNLISFAKDVKSETLKITWPSKRETVITSIMVFFMIAFFALFFFFVDQILGFGIKLILGMGA
jgi:preprotein translocase subunit SecE